MTVVVTSLNHLDISLCNCGLLGKFLLQEVEGNIQITVEEPADKSEGKHITAFQDSLIVHPGIGKCILYHLCERTLDHAVRINAHFTEVVFRLEGSLLQVVGTERVRIYDNRSLWLCIFQLSLQRSRIHGHKHIGLITRCVNLTGTNMHLKTRDARQ